MASKGVAALPVRLIISCLRFCEISDVFCAQSVCKGWHLAQDFMELLVRPRYAETFEPETSDSKAIAPNGKQTLWAVRWRRRLETQRRFVAREFRMSNIPVDNASVTCVGYSGGRY